MLERLFCCYKFSEFPTFSSLQTFSARSLVSSRTCLHVRTVKAGPGSEHKVQMLKHLNDQ